MYKHTRLKVNSIQCTKCRDVLVSTEFRKPVKCSCYTCTLDGGNEFFVATGDYINLSEEEPKSLDEMTKDFTTYTRLLKEGNEWYEHMIDDVVAAAKHYYGEDLETNS